MDNRYILFVALTRPAINKWGIPQHCFTWGVVATSGIGMWAGRGSGMAWQGICYVVPAAVLFFGLRALTEWDHNFVRILQLWFSTKAKGLGKPGGSVLSPLPSGLPSRTRDIAGAV